MNINSYCHVGGHWWASTNICKKSNDSNHCNPQPHSCSFDKLFFFVGETKQLAMNWHCSKLIYSKKTHRALTFSKGQHLIFSGDLRVSTGYLPKRKYSYFKKVLTRYYAISGAPDFSFFLFFQRSSCLTYHHLNCTTLRFWDGKYGALGSYGTINMSSSQSRPCGDGGGGGFAWCGSMWFPQNGHGEIWIWCVVLLMEEIPKNRLLDVWNAGKNGMNYQHQLVGRISSINSVSDVKMHMK